MQKITPSRHGRFPALHVVQMILLALVGMIMVAAGMPNDAYRTVPTGQYIAAHGIAFADFLSLHDSMRIVLPQWLTCVIYAKIYTLGGTVGIKLTCCLCYLLLTAGVYRFCRAVCGNRFVASAATAVIALLSAGLVTSLPSFFTLIIFTAQLLCLETYVQQKKKAVLWVLPLLSLLLVNLDGASWLLFFAIALPYAAAALPLKCGNYRQKPCCDILPLLFCGAACFCAGLINPYGWQAMLYGTALLNSDVVLLQNRLAPASFSSLHGMLFFALLALCAGLLCVKKIAAVSTRFTLLFIITAGMAFINIALLPCFVLFGTAAFTHSFGDEKTSRHRLRKPAVALLLVLLCAVSGVLTSANARQSVQQKEDAVFLAEAATLLQNEEDVILFAGVETGAYMEYAGFRPYLDNRIELFQKQVNGNADYLREYYRVINGDKDSLAFIKQYGFTHLIVTENEPALRTALRHDSRFRVLAENERTTLFEAPRALP